MISHSYPAVPGQPVVVSVAAEIDVTTAGQLDLVLLEAAVRGHGTVVVDMTGCQFCDCAGLRVLIQAHERALAAGGGLRLLLPADGVVPRMFTLAGFDHAIPVFASLADALRPEPSA